MRKDVLVFKCYYQALLHFLLKTSLSFSFTQRLLLDMERGQKLEVSCQLHVVHVYVCMYMYIYMYT